MTNTGAKPVDCGMGSDYGLFAYVGCGKVAVSMNEFQKRVTAELKKQGWTKIDPWRDGDLNGMPTRGTGGERPPYILRVEVHWPPKEFPATVFMLWLRTREPTEEERRMLERQDQNK